MQYGRLVVYRKYLVMPATTPTAFVYFCAGKAKKNVHKAHNVNNFFMAFSLNPCRAQL